MSLAKVLLPSLCLACTPEGAPRARMRDAPAPVSECPEDMNRVAREGDSTGFCLDILEATVFDYKRCVAAGACTPAVTDGGWGCNLLFPARDNHPINCVDLDQANHYCRWRGKRVPRDEEWLWAAHGGTRGTAYPWGDTLDPGRACTDRGKAEGTCAVAAFDDASPDGLRDLVGNVAEWTYQGERGGLRGGSWRYRPNLQPDDWRSEQTSPQSGIRCAADLGAMLVELPAVAAPPPSRDVALGLTGLPGLVPARPLVHLDVLARVPTSHRFWAELADGQFIPFPAEDLPAYGLTAGFDGAASPTVLTGCTPLRGLRSTVILACERAGREPRLVAIDRADRATVWEQPLQDFDLVKDIYFGPTHFVVVDTEAGEAIGYSFGDGRPVWGHAITPETPLWTDDTGIYVVNRHYRSPMLQALDLATGEMPWDIAASCGPVHSDGLILEDKHGFHRIDPTTGAVQTTIGVPRGECESMLARDHVPFVAHGRRFERAWTADHRPLLRAADLATGRVLWEHALASSLDYDTLVVSEDAVYWLEDDRLLAVDSATGVTAIALPISHPRPAPRLLAAGGAFGPLVVVTNMDHTIILGRVAARSSLAVAPATSATSTVAPIRSTTRSRSESSR